VVYYDVFLHCYALSIDYYGQFCTVMHCKLIIMTAFELLCTVYYVIYGLIFGGTIQKCLKRSVFLQALSSGVLLDPNLASCLT
jgi:hypothetical protein